MLNGKRIDNDSQNIEGDNNITIKTKQLNIYNINSKEEKSIIDIKSDLKPKNEYINKINKVDFVSTTKKLTLNNLFVCPNFSFVGTDSNEDDLKGNLDIFFDFSNKLSFIKGTELSGKTSIGNKIFLDSLEKNVYSLIINGKHIDKSTLNYEKLIRKSFEEQYDGKYEEFISLEKTRILIIDDFHHNINFSLIESLKGLFSKIIFLISDEEYLVYFREDKYYTNIDLYSIKLFNYTNQHSLIFNWYKNEYGEEDELYDSNFDAIENKINDIVTKHNIVPKTAFYLLTIIQSFENFTPTNLQITSYGHCYEILITSQLLKKNINIKDIPDCYNFLTHLSYKIYSLNKENGQENISIEEYKKFKKEYGEKFLPINKSILSKIENNDYRILNINNNIRFEFQYIYYYFVGKYIANKIYQDGDKDIGFLTENIYKKSYSHILVFTIHHTDNPDLLDQIQLQCMYSFEGEDDIKLTTQETNFMTELLNELPNNILANKSINESRIKERELKDKQEQNIKQNNINEEEETIELMELNKSFKIIEVLGQIIKNRAGNIEKERIQDLLLEVEKLGFRLTSLLLNTLKSNEFYESINKRIEILEGIKNNNLSSENKRKNIEKFIQLMAMGTVHGILFKLFQAVGVDKVLSFQKRITKDNPYPSYELLNLLFIINFDNIDYKYIHDLYNKYSDEKNIWAIRSLSYFIQIYMNTHNVDFRLKQQLCSLLGIVYKPNKFLK